MPELKSEVEVASSFFPRITAGKIWITSKVGFGVVEARKSVVEERAICLDAEYPTKELAKDACGEGTGARSISTDC